MTDRFRNYNQAGRSATFNPARASLPASIGYSSLYAGDMHVMPSPTRSQHSATSSASTPRGYITSTTTSGTPTTTTRTYTVTHDPRNHRPAVRDLSRNRSGRSSTLESSQRPPVIITTTQKDRPPIAPAAHTPVTARPSSPMHDSYRASEGQFFTQPASSIRSRSTVRPESARPYSAQIDADEYARHRERNETVLATTDYRSARPSVTYPSNPRHSTATVDYGDEGYQYTNAGELARYDLDQTRPSRSSRRESTDRGYHRPNINYNTEQRSFNINASPDLSRNYNMNTSRPYEGRGGPPPTTRGFDKISRAYEPPREGPISPPLLDPIPNTQLEIAGAAGDGRRSRPVSLYQDAPQRSSHHEEFYRSREDERTMRELRDRDHNREPERIQDATYFHDDRVPSRGFGIRTEVVDNYDDRWRREQPLEEPKKRSDESLPSREPDLERPRSRVDVKDSRPERRDRRESRRGSDEDEKDRSRFRDKISTGLGIAATAVGLNPSKDEEKREEKRDERREKETEPRKRRPSDEDRERERRRDDEYDRSRVGEQDRPRTRDYDYDRDRRDPRGEIEYKERTRRDADPRSSEQAIASASDSDEGKRSRRHRPSNAFDPNDAGDLKQIKEQLAAMKTSEKEKDFEKDSKPVVVESSRTRSSSASRESKPEPPKDDPRGRELVSHNSDEKQVRVVSPPRDKKDEKPLKGILKQPRPAFPEEPNPIREGVAPHKEDKKLKEAPAGAKWTKISRKVVNPEALTIGKERFEVRDDFVIVLRVLSKDEIQAYAAATQVLRERRRREEESDRDRDYDRDDDERHRHHRHRRHHDEDDREDDRDRDRERRRRHRDDDEYDHHHSHRT